MRQLILLASILAIASGCGSSSSGGAVKLSFGDAGPLAADFTTTPAGAAHVTGEFSATGDYEAEYSLTTKVPSGSPIASCLVSIDGKPPTASAQIDDSTGQTHTLSVEIVLASGYQGQAVCNVSAMNASKPNVGDEAAIVVAGSNG